MKRLFILTLCSVVLSLVICFLKGRHPATVAAGNGSVLPKQWLQNGPLPRTPENDRRPADQTFLTFPEWFLVFSPDEQARYFKQHTATGFPYMTHTAQIWQSYHIVDEQIKGNFQPNPGYHFMIWVIGSSASIEYGLKAWYETLIGRITDTQVPLTDEDKFNARFAQAYVDFIKVRPWYEFDFKSQLKDLWGDVPLWGDHFLRKAERRYLLTSELLVKFLYGKLIGLGTDQVYDEALPTTAVVLENDSLKWLPRYDPFASAALALAQEGHTFKEITGNSSAILLTVLVPAQKLETYGDAKVIFTQTISSNPSAKRVAMAIPVPRLATLLLQLNQQQVKVEHVFDF